MKSKLINILIALVQLFLFLLVMLLIGFKMETVLLATMLSFYGQLILLSIWDLKKD